MDVKSPRTVVNTGIKPKRSSSKKVSSYTSGNSSSDYSHADLSLDVSFSFGSSDEEGDDFKREHSQLHHTQFPETTVDDGLVSKGLTQGLTLNKKPSKRMFARRNKNVHSDLASTKTKGSSSGSGSGSSKFLPISQREKQKRASKLLQQRQEDEPPVAPHLTLADLVRNRSDDGKLYKESWRQKNDINRKAQVSNERQTRDQNETGRSSDDSSSGFFDCLLNAIASSGGCTESMQTKNIVQQLDEPDGVSVNGSKYSSSTKSLSSTDDSLDENQNDKYVMVKGLKVDRYAIPTVNTSADSTAFHANYENGVSAIKDENWKMLLNIMTLKPKILLQQPSTHRKRNLLHILAGQHSEIPNIVVETMVNMCPEIVSQVDIDGCAPLHHMVYSGGKVDLVNLLLQCWPEATSLRNVDGDIPLHVSVWAGTGNEKVAHSLMNANPMAVGEVNNAGGTPLHLACCEKNASSVIVKMIIETQMSMDIPFNTFDNNGNSPLHVAIKTKAPKEVISVIYAELGSEPFSTPDNKRVYPLQMAMSIKHVDPEVVSLVCTAAPKVMKKPMTNGMMPVCMASERDMPDKIVKLLLLADSPIKFMPNMHQIRDVALRIHSHSWWHLATTDGKYAPVIDDILSNLASIHEIISLCQEPDSNGYSSVFDRAHRDVKEVMRKNLVFAERYRVAPEYKTTIDKGVILLCAVDYGNDTAWEDMYSSRSKHGPQSDEQTQREVLLHCCLTGSEEYRELVEEINARQRFNFSYLHSQRLFNIHTLNALKIGCTGEMLCLAFERPLLTLQEIFETSRFRKRKNQQWARKSVNLLLSLGRVLKYFHTVGFVHGYVEPGTIGKFQGSNNWKMLDMRRATPLGHPMKGELRPGSPPESVSKTNVKPWMSEVVKLVSFDENIVGQDTSKDSEGDHEPMETLEYHPSQCMASTSWDIWSYGLIMGQLVLGQSMVLLPNFEKASDAHLRNLHQYDDEALNKIYEAAKRVSGENAANLLESLLQPKPENRPQSMNEVLSHKYFNEMEE
mmetsp:Transcript_10687/g.13516  ORF Transcript_10687/g.13516 Transcript_10687/m.13516 type:complete len:1019 (+) Transcript_10687:228-3284(+)